MEQEATEYKPAWSSQAIRKHTEQGLAAKCQNVVKQQQRRNLGQSRRAVEAAKLHANRSIGNAMSNAKAPSEQKSGAWEADHNTPQVDKTMNAVNSR